MNKFLILGCLLVAACGDTNITVPEQKPAYQATGDIVLGNKLTDSGNTTDTKTDTTNINGSFNFNNYSSGR